MPGSGSAESHAPGHRRPGQQCGRRPVRPLRAAAPTGGRSRAWAMTAARVVINIADLERCARTADQVAGGLWDDATRLRRPFPVMPPDIAAYVVERADLLAGDLASAVGDLHTLASDERRVAAAAEESGPSRWIEPTFMFPRSMMEIPAEAEQHPPKTP